MYSPKADVPEAALHFSNVTVAVLRVEDFTASINILQCTVLCSLHGNCTAKFTPNPLIKSLDLEFTA